MVELVLQTSINALVAASFIALIAVGLVLIFGVMRIVNFAHGELFMTGAYVVWYLYAQQSWPFLLAVVAAGAAVCALGMGMERLLFRPMRGNQLGGLIMSVGALFILQVGAVQIGGVNLMKHVPPAVPGAIPIPGFEGVSVPGQRLVVIGVSLTLLCLTWLLLHRTKVGWALRACAQDPEAASLQGISINRYALVAMGLSAALAGVAGGIMAPLVRVGPYMGHSVIVTAFIVIIVGGVGSVEGAVLAAVLYSFLDTFITTFFDGSLATIVGLVVMMLVLVVRPTGILGTAEKV
jgi:branched-chain amino acid transport system permease protein